MVLAKLWYHTAIICANENKFYTIKNCKNVEIMCNATSSYDYYLT